VDTFIFFLSALDFDFIPVFPLLPLVDNPSMPYLRVTLFEVEVPIAGLLCHRPG